MAVRVFHNWDAFQSSLVIPVDWVCVDIVRGDNDSWKVCYYKSINLPRKYLGSLYSSWKNLSFTVKWDQSSAMHIVFFKINKNKVTVWKQTIRKQIFSFCSQDLLKHRATTTPTAQQSAKQSLQWPGARDKLGGRYRSANFRLCWWGEPQRQQILILWIPSR